MIHTKNTFLPVVSFLEKIHQDPHLFLRVKDLTGIFQRTPVQHEYTDKKTGYYRFLILKR